MRVFDLCSVHNHQVSILQRLQGDASKYAQQKANARTPQLASLLEQQTQTIAEAVVVAEEATSASIQDAQRAAALENGKAALATAVAEAERLVDGLEEQRRVDQAFVTKGIEHVVRSVGPPHTSTHPLIWSSSSTRPIR